MEMLEAIRAYGGSGLGREWPTALLRGQDRSHNAPRNSQDELSAAIPINHIAPWWVTRCSA